MGTTRQFQWDDLPAVVDVMNTYALALGGNGGITLEQIEPRWRSPYNHPERDCFVSVEADGQIVGFTIADLLDAPDRAVGVYTVPPKHHAAAESLIRAAEDHFVQMAAGRTTLGTPLTMEWRVSDKDRAAITCLEAAGYQNARAFYTMRILLDETITAVPLPGGFTLRPFHVEMLEAVFAAKNDAFLDHWGEDNQTLEEWRADIQQPGFDPSLWWIAYADDSDEIAGMVLSRPADTHTAWVEIVGVRQVWRNQGLASALLTQCFAEYQRRGWRQIDLNVDTGSSTHAVALYQKSGMHIRARQLYYQMTLPRTEPSRPFSPQSLSV